MLKYRHSPYDARRSHHINIRKSVRSPQELTNLRSAHSSMMSIKDNRGFMYQAGIHGIPQFKCKHGEVNDPTISDPNFRLFLPWHRAYLYWFEQYLQDAQKDSTITVPWWDWTSNDSKSEGIPKAYSDAKVNGSPNSLYTFHVILPDSVNLDDFIDRTACPKSKAYDTHREAGSPSLLPTPQDVEAILNLTDYGDFSDGLEDIHNRIHVWVGGKCGDMSYVPSAAYDPIF
jgi:tyrosinase